MQSIWMKDFVAPIPLWMAGLMCAAGWAVAQFGVLRKSGLILAMDCPNCLILGFSLILFPCAMPIATLVFCFFLLRLYLRSVCEREWAAYPKRRHAPSDPGQELFSSAVPGHADYGNYGGVDFGGGHDGGGHG